MDYAIKLSEAFQLVDKIAPVMERIHRKNKKITNDDDPKYNGRGGDKAKVGKGGNSGHNSSNRKIPVCLYPPHEAKGYTHYLKDSTVCSNDQRKATLKSIVKKRVATGPSKSTSGQLKLKEHGKLKHRWSCENCFGFHVIIICRLR